MASQLERLAPARARLDADAAAAGTGWSPFIGVINLRWQPGERPPSLSGHVGAAVAPWTQRRGHATEGLRLMPGEAQAAGLGLAEITPDPSNSPSQEPIRRCGGVQVATRDNPFTGSPTVHARIDLAL
jgi:predicted acetyltransferase